MILLLPLARSESSWLRISFVAEALAVAPPNTVIGEVTRSITPDEVKLFGRTKYVLLAFDVGIIWSVDHMRTSYIRKSTLHAGGVEMIWRESSMFFQEFQQLAEKQVEFCVNNLQDLEGVRDNLHSVCFFIYDLIC